MTPMSMWLLGLLGIASVLMSIYLMPIVRTEFQSSEHWQHNKAFWLSAALWFHSFGALLLIGATLVAGVQYRNTTSVYLLWSAWAFWIVTKNIIVAVIGRWELAVILSVIWTIAMFATRFQ